MKTCDGCRAIFFAGDERHYQDCPSHSVRDLEDEHLEDEHLAFPIDVAEPLGKKKSGGNQNAEHDALKAAIRLDLGSRPDCRAFSNTNGVARYGNARVPYGLVKGAHDIVCIVKRQLEYAHREGCNGADWTAQPQDCNCGRSVGVWLTIEVKTGNAKMTTDQAAFADMIRAFGGVSGVARSIEDARRLYNEARGAKI